MFRLMFLYSDYWICPFKNEHILTFDNTLFHIGGYSDLLRSWLGLNRSTADNPVPLRRTRLAGNDMAAGPKA
jgi:hypothetical protein